MRSRIILATIIGIIAVGLFFSNIPLADALQDITLEKIKHDKKWSKINVRVSAGFTDIHLSDLTVTLAVVNELNLNEYAFSVVNAGSLEKIDSKHMEITKINVDKKGKMNIESEISELTITSPNNILVIVQITNSNGEIAFSQTYVK